MATKDLGNVQVDVQTRGPRAPSGDASGAIAGGVMGVIGAVKQDIDDTYVSEGRAEFEDIINEIKAEGEKPVSEEMGPPESRQGTPYSDPVAENLARDILNAESAIRQGPSNLVGRARLELKSKLQQLRNRRPSLARRLESELSSVVTYDPEYAILEMMDAESAKMVAESQEDIERIKEFAYDRTIANGGWGLQPGVHPFGSQEFILAGANAARIQSEIAANEVALKSIEAGEVFDERASLAAFSDKLQGNGNLLKLRMAQYDEAIETLGIAYQTPGSAQSMDVIQQYTSPGGALDQLNSTIALTIQEINSDLIRAFPGNLATSKEYERAREMANQQIGMLQTLQQGLASQDAGVIDLWNTWKAGIEWKFEHDNPGITNRLRYMEATAPMLDYLAKNDLTGEGIVLQHDIAKAMAGDVRSVMGRGAFWASGLADDATPEEVRDYRETMMTMNPDLYGTGVPSPTNNQVAAMQELQEIRKVTPIVIDQAKTGAADPDLVKVIYSQKALDMAMARPAKLADEDLSKLWDSVIDPDMRYTASVMYNKAPGAMKDFVDQYESIHQRYRKIQDRDYAEIARREVDTDLGVTAGKVFRIETDGVKEGKGIRVTVSDQDLMANIRLAEKELATLGNEPVQGPPISLESRMERGMEVAKREAAELERRLNRDLSNWAEFRAIKAGRDTIDWEDAWNTGQFNTYFGEVDDGEAE